MSFFSALKTCYETVSRNATNAPMPSIRCASCSSIATPKHFLNHSPPLSSHVTKLSIVARPPTTPMKIRGEVVQDGSKYWSRSSKLVAGK
jgi:hypothetical protein